MFTGIIQATGKIVQVKPSGDDSDRSLSIMISSESLDMADVLIGDSIAVNGVCLTVTVLHGRLFEVDISPETLKCTQGLDRPDQAVNLEKALRLSDRLGGHLVSGHVDATAEVLRFLPVGANYQLTLRSPKHLLRYITHKGSITVNGVSLTVNAIDNDEVSINLIPHTLSMTNLNALKPGMQVNLETDMLARYVENLLHRPEA
ncbi:MAG: riboflavin synthase [Nitrosomonas sp.]|nr:riboflavin synthase [Burkholderiales bacterium]MDR4520357.1 riboflavin synthase [Nitrosomonas sp.]